MLLTLTFRPTITLIMVSLNAAIYRFLNWPNLKTFFFPLDYSRFRESHTEQLEKLKDVITSLNEEIALRDANMIECEGRYRELERAFENLTNERDSKLRVIELLEEEMKTKQIENRRMDERVNFLESAMDYLRGEMSEKLSELDDLKASSSLLFSQLSQRTTDLHSAINSQATLQDSLDKANEKIEELERLLVDLNLEKLTLAQHLDSTDASHSAEKHALLQELTDARSAQDTAKADLEDLQTELEAGRAALSNHSDLLAHKEAIHAALISAHDALLEKQKSLDDSLLALRSQNESLTASSSEKDAIALEKDNLIRENEDKFDRESQELKQRISGLTVELSSSLASIEEQQQVVSNLQDEVESLRQAEAHGAQKISELEMSLSASFAQIAALTLRSDSLTTEVTSLTANVETLKSELNTALVSAFDIMNAKSEAAQDHADRETQHLDAQKNFINQIAELQTSLRSERDSSESLRVDLEKKVVIIEECFNGKLETESEKHRRTMETVQSDFSQQIEKLEALLAEKSGAVASKVQQIEKFEAHIEEMEAQMAQKIAIVQSKEKQVEKCEAQIAKLQSDSASQMVNFDEQVEKLNAQIEKFNSQIEKLDSQLSASSQLVMAKDEQLEEASSQLQKMESEHKDREATFEGHIAKLKTDADLTQQVHYEQMATLHTSMAELKRELSEMESSRSLQVEEMRAKYLSVSSTLATTRDRVTSLEKDKSDLEESELEMKKALIAEREARAQEVAQKDSDVAAALSKARSLEEALGEAKVEQSALKTTLKKVESELAKYKTEMSETDAVLALAQAECDELKKDRKQWMSLAEQQKIEMEQAFRLMKEAQDEVEAVTAKNDQLAAKYEKVRLEKAEEEKAENDLRVKKLSHEVRMLTAELARNKNRVTTRDTAIQAGKLREEKLQANLDVQIEKSRDLARQLADRDRETIIERGRAKSVGTKDSSSSKPQVRLRSASKTEKDDSSPTPEDLDIPTLDEYHDIVAQLSSAKAEILKMQKQLEVEKTQIDCLIADQTKLTGHNNPKQKIQFTHKLMTENHELKLERANLLAQLEKRGFDSPHRKSITRSIVAKVRPASTTITSSPAAPSAKDGENGALLQKGFDLDTSIDAENVANF